MFSPGLSLELSCIELVFNEQSIVIFWISWCKNKSFWQRFTYTNAWTTTFVIFVCKIKVTKCLRVVGTHSNTRTVRLMIQIIFILLRKNSTSIVFVNFSIFVKKSPNSVGTGYSFWDRLHNFLHKYTCIVLSVHKLNKLGKFW